MGKEVLATKKWPVFISSDQHSLVLRSDFQMSSVELFTNPWHYSKAHLLPWHYSNAHLLPWHYSNAHLLPWHYSKAHLLPWHYSNAHLTTSFLESLRGASALLRTPGRSIWKLWDAWINVDRGSLSTNHEMASQTSSSNADVFDCWAAGFFRADINAVHGLISSLRWDLRLHHHTTAHSM